MAWVQQTTWTAEIEQKTSLNMEAREVEAA